MTDLSPGLGLPYLQPSQAQKHVTHNQALQVLDQLVQLRITSFDAVAPPSLPVPGESHALAVSATGAWAGQDGMLALWEAAGWRFLAPQEGWLAWDLGAARLRSWSAAMGWTLVQLDQLDQLGIGTAADASNRLAVSAAATLLSHDGGGHQLKINKASPSDTASLVLQSNWLGHAELGLIGDSAFALKVSADGASWSQVMRADPVAQKIDWAAAGPVQMSLSATDLVLDVPLTGTAVQSGLTDTTGGRLALVGAFGWGVAQFLALPGGNIDDTTVPSGAYRVSANTMTGVFPPGLTFFGTLMTQRYDASNVVQMVTRITGGFEQYRRSSVSGVWTGWQLIYDQSSILGAVSQTSGTPTGAVIERGSNGNGSYLRFADGTQICTHGLPLAYSAANKLSAVWTYPALFAALPTIQGSVDISDFGSNATPLMEEVGGVNAGSILAASAAVQLFRISGLTDFASADTGLAHVTAIGRWF